MSGLRRRIRLGPGREFDLIRRCMGADEELPTEVFVGPGDDAAVLKGGWVISTDMSVEDVHFRRAWISDEEIGYRCAAAALSDLAAMAATPVGALVSMAAPAADVDVEAVQAGIRAAAASVGATVIGGDMSRSPGPLVLDVVVLGCTSWPVLRDGAEPEDEVWVTGTLGASTAAVKVWERGAAPDDALRATYAHPRPRVDEARWLVDREWVDALIDVSDGLAGDAGHLAAASGVKITLEIPRIPVAEAAEAALGREGALDAALHGGEDFELCFVTDPGKVDPEEFERRFGLPLTRVGIVSEGAGVWLVDEDGTEHAVERGGFDHWGGVEP
jgi:thiamine-monophosphate kinase